MPGFFVAVAGCGLEGALNCLTFFPDVVVVPVLAVLCFLPPHPATASAATRTRTIPHSFTARTLHRVASAGQTEILLLPERRDRSIGLVRHESDRSAPQVAPRLSEMALPAAPGCVRQVHQRRGRVREPEVQAPYAHHVVVHHLVGPAAALDAAARVGGVAAEGRVHDRMVALPLHPPRVPRKRDPLV